jgi:single-stranded DNA-binding protein
MNTIVISGRIVGRDATKKDVGSTGVINFSVSDSRKVKGEWQTTFFDVALWGNRDGLLPYLVKGTNVVVSGELQAPVVKGEKCYLSVRAYEVTLVRDKEAEVTPSPAEMPF